MKECLKLLNSCCTNPQTMHSIIITISHKKKIFQRIKYKFLYSLDFELNSEANQIIRISTGGSGEPKAQAASIRGASSVREEKPILQKWVYQEETQQAVDMPLNGWQQQAGNDSTCIIAKPFLFMARCWGQIDIFLWLARSKKRLHFILSDTQWAKTWIRKGHRLFAYWVAPRASLIRDFSEDVRAHTCGLSW